MDSVKILVKVCLIFICTEQLKPQIIKPIEKILVKEKYENRNGANNAPPRFSTSYYATIRRAIPYDGPEYIGSR